MNRRCLFAAFWAAIAWMWGVKPKAKLWVGTQEPVPSSTWSVRSLFDKSGNYHGQEIIRYENGEAAAFRVLDRMGHVVIRCGNLKLRG